MLSLYINCLKNCDFRYAIKYITDLLNNIFTGTGPFAGTVEFINKLWGNKNNNCYKWFGF